MLRTLFAYDARDDAPSANNPGDLAMAAELEALPAAPLPLDAAVRPDTCCNDRSPPQRQFEAVAVPGAMTQMRERIMPLTQVYRAARPPPSRTTRSWPSSQRTMRTRMIVDAAGARVAATVAEAVEAAEPQRTTRHRPMTMTTWSPHQRRHHRP